MKIENSLKSRRYFKEIVTSISVAVLVVVIVLSGTVYLNSQQILLKKEYETNKKILYQVKFNVDFMDTTIRDICKFLYINNDIESIIYTKKEDIVDLSTKVNKIVSSIASTNPYIHSITIYNNNLKQFYNIGQPLFLKEEQLLSLMEAKQIVPKLKPISRKIEKMVNDKKEYENVFSYFIYEKTDDFGRMDGAIVVNVKTDWLLDNIRKVNMIEKDKGDNIFVLDQNNEYIEDQISNKSSNKDLNQWLKDEYIRYIAQQKSDEMEGFFKSKFNNVHYMITYTKVDKEGITLLKIQQLSEVYKNITQLKNSILIIMMIFIMLAALASIFISRRIYKPIDNVVKLMMSYKNQNVDDENLKDEITYINSTYKNSMDKLDSYEKERSSYENVMKHYWLNKLLTESFSLEGRKLPQAFEEANIALTTDESFLVCVVKVDEYRNFQQAYKAKDRELLRYAIINITSEVISRKYVNEGIDMKDDSIVLILNIPKEDPHYIANITPLVQEAMKHIKHYFNLSVTASLSDKSENEKEISTLYKKAMEDMDYRLLLGHSAVITVKDTERSQENIAYSKDVEEKLLDSIQSCSIDAVKEYSKSIFDEISHMHYDNALIALIILADRIKKAVEKVWISNGQYSYVEFPSIKQCIMEKETITEIYDIIINYLMNMLVQSAERSEDAKDLYIVDAIRQYIEKNYMDTSLCLTKIADVMNISSRRLSKIFKDAAKVSVAEYINGVRLDKAANLLLNSPMNVNEIIGEVGIENETYFYGMFKKRFGLTPKEYAFKRIVSISQNNGHE